MRMRVKVLLAGIAFIAVLYTVFFYLPAYGQDKSFCPQSFFALEDTKLDEQALAKWVRPVVPVVLDPNNEIVATAETRGVALVLSRDEILVSSAPFIVAPSLVRVAEYSGMKSSLLHVGAMIIWNVLPDGATGTLNAEIIPYIPLEELGTGANPLVLSRSPVFSAKFPAPDKFPYALIDHELCAFESLVVVGHWKTLKPELIMTFNEAKVRSLGNDFVLLDGSLARNDWGAVVFGLRKDGTFGLVGVIRDINLKKRRESEIFMIEIGKINGLPPQGSQSSKEKGS